MREIQTSGASDVRSGLVVNTLRHRFVLIIAVGFLGLAGGLAFTQVRPPAYTSSASLLVNPVEGNPYSPEGQRDDLVSLETEAQVVGSDEVIRLVRARLSGGLSEEQLQEGVAVVVPPNTQIIRISFTASDPTVARDTTQAFALAYLDHRLEQANTLQSAQITAIDEQIDQVVSDLREATAASGRGSEAERRFQSEYAASLSSELLSLRAQRFGVQQSVARPGRVISPAEAPQQKAGLSRWVLATAGLAAGLLVGLAVALTQERSADRLYTLRDVAGSGVRPLAKLPRAPLVGQHGRSSAEETEAVRRIRAAVMSKEAPRSVLSISCCSSRVPEPGVAARLSASLWRAGATVVLVDGTGGTLDPSGLIRSDDAEGFSEALLDDPESARDRLVARPDEKLQVLHRGRRLSQSADRMLPSTLQTALRPITAEADFVVLRAPSIGDTGGEVCASVADATILVATAGQTSRTELLSGAASVLDAGGTLLGAVLARPPRRPRARRGRASMRSTRSPEPASDEVTALVS